MKKSLKNKRKLKNNKYQQNIDAQLDLHGLTLEEAKEKVRVFLSDSKKKGLKKVLIITGKGIHSEGEGVLKNAIPAFIRSLNFFCIGAKIAHGGEGAFEVIL